MAERDANYQYSSKPPCLWDYGPKTYAVYFYFDPTAHHRRRHGEVHCRYTKLRECSRCGRLGIDTRILYRHEICEAAGYFHLQYPSELSYCYMCFECWGAIGWIFRRLNECHDIDRLISKIERVSRQCQKNRKK